MIPSFIVLTCHRSNFFMAHFQSIHDVEEHNSFYLDWNMQPESGELLHKFRMLPIYFSSINLSFASSMMLLGKKVFLNSTLNFSHLLMVQTPFPIFDLFDLHHNMAIFERYKTQCLYFSYHSSPCSLQQIRYLTTKLLVMT